MAERISRDDVLNVARLANLSLSNDELATYTSQLGAVLEHAADVEALDLDDVEPTTHPYPLCNVWREDVPGPTIDREEVLAEAPSADQHRFKVPTILGDAP